MTEVGTVVFVPGTPAPQGSKSFVGRAKSGKGLMVESSKAVEPWREAIRSALIRDANPLWPMIGPVRVDLTFLMPRPKRIGQRTDVPMVTRPDTDKLSRAVLDAVGSAGVWNDDSQVTLLIARKVYAAPGRGPGLLLTITAE